MNISIFLKGICVFDTMVQKFNLKFAFWRNANSYFCGFAKIRIVFVEKSYISTDAKY